MTYFQFALLFIWGWITATLVIASPIRRDLTSTLLLNSPAFQDPKKPTDTIAAVQSFVYLSQPNLSLVQKFLEGVLKNELKVVGDFEQKVATAVERMKLFATVGVPEVHVDVAVEGCSRESKLPHTEFKNLGIVSAIASLGSCPFANANSGSASKTAKLSLSDGDATPATTFYSPPGGLGVISDVDDTIKVTNVLNKTLLMENTLYKNPVPIAGMPNLYSHLAKALISQSDAGKTITPQFLYVSGSPFQLYPFLSDFLKSHFPDSNGPLFLQNLSITDLSLIFDQFGGGKDQAKVDYKVKQINKIQGMYPKKSFLAVGDSTEMDPEVYGKIFREHKDFIRCIWIHVVDGAKNEQTRFDAAFEGVPKEKYRLYKDSEIEDLKQIDVAGGKC
ncbi:hypothetical protein GYMLUDRAFT_889270 [Collybiopsis luxurians FD-317 M1]|uniref:Phosphatidate phosphatase APP1 catalytic domain-containing protein n=1 Tax=Collybiopsis luxurians FD-317 M1 TaxID=944289 RepID=A0A0D0BJI3_9AGAR|nr:hypothetical protein GYMLUDRAFT_889270 [Collybiopsis luxurians FD-317 M1]